MSHCDTNVKQEVYMSDKEVKCFDAKEVKK
jgi:hypothetical protein